MAKLFEVCMLKDGASFRTEAKPMAVAWASHTHKKSKYLYESEL